MSDKKLWLLLAVILLLRLLGLDAYPLMDSSEARYAEMARKMVELNNWVTPMFSDQQPFWGKPPLSFWSQAVGIKLFGPGEFSSRFPGWLFHVGSCALLIAWGRRCRLPQKGLLAAIIFSSCSLGLVASGAVLTDPALNFSLLLALFGFWFAITEGGRWPALLGFAGLGLGLLAKGPLILMLFGTPALLWVARYRQWASLWALPWGWGLLLMTAIAAPWYLLAEQRSPGFWHYFFVGEHWQRFTVSGWQGDLYGSAHARPQATIWLYFVAALLPWSLLPLIELGHRLRAWRSGETAPLMLASCRDDPRLRQMCSLLLYCALTAPLLFTLSRNILWTYVLPSLPACAMLLALRYQPLIAAWPRVSTALALALPLLLIAVILEGSAFKSYKNQRPVIDYWLQHSDEIPLYYLKRHYYSAQYYSAGQSRLWPQNGQAHPEACQLYLASRQRKLPSQLPETLDCQHVDTRNKTALYLCRQHSRRCQKSSAEPREVHFKGQPN